MSSYHPIVKQSRTLHQSQLSRIQAKNDEDIALIDNINQYMRKRIDLEKEYYERLEKLAKGFQGKKGSGSTTTPRPTQQVFQALLAATESEAIVKQNICEKIGSDIIEVVRDYNKGKITLSKKKYEQCSRYHEELLRALTELDTSRKEYEEAAKAFDSAQRKYDDSLKKPKGALSIMKNALSSADSEKLKVKLKSWSRKLLDARNQYILSMEASNVIQDLYWKEDLPKLMKDLDADYHPTVSSLFDTYADLAQSYVKTVSDSINNVSALARKVDRDVEHKQFLAENDALFPGPKVLRFEPFAGDKVTSVTIDDISKVVLSNKLTALMQRKNEISKNLNKSEKEIAGLEQMAKVYKESPEFGNATNPIETMNDLEFQIQMLRIDLKKVDVQIEVLKNAGVEVLTPAVLSTLPTTAAAVNAAVPARRSSVRATPKPTATVIYEYHGADNTELTIREGDVLTIYKDEPADPGWLVAELNGRKGLVPESYVQMNPDKAPSRLSVVGLAAALPSAASNIVQAVYDYAAQEPGELSFSAGDSIQVIEHTSDGDISEYWEGKNQRTGKVGTFPYIFTVGWENIVGAGGVVQSPTTASSTSLGRRGSSPVTSPTVDNRVRAMYDYNPACEGELAMTAGDIIAVTNRDTGSEAWWEGRNLTSGLIGQFPKDYCQPL